jgi:hypothetical protein
VDVPGQEQIHRTNNKIGVHPFKIFADNFY